MSTIGCRRTRSCGKMSRQSAVERAESYARANIATPMPIARLCRVVGLSERGLRNAFYAVRGMSPKRSLLFERLTAVRQDLRSAAARPTTVTRAATSYGFYELGRFSVIYKKTFGESPFETLREANPELSARRHSRTKGHAHA